MDIEKTLDRYSSLLTGLIASVVQEVVWAFFGKGVLLTGRMRAYLDDELACETPEQRALREETEKRGGDAVMQSDPSQAAFLSWLIRDRGAKRVLEIGTFTGYGTLAFALAVPADGVVVTCDIDPDLPKVGLPFWGKAGVESRIDPQIGPALDTIAKLKARGAQFDFVYIDANKLEYGAYLEAVTALLAPNAIVAVDNTLWHGRVANDLLRGAAGEALRRFNEGVFGRKGYPPPDRFDPVMLPCWDGLVLLKLRPTKA